MTAQIGNYLLLRELESGRFEAQHQASGAHVLITLFSGPSSGEERSRIAREIAAVSTTGDENILQTIDYGQTDGKQYVVSELHGARTLEEEVKAKGAFGIFRCYSVVDQIAKALSIAHRCGVIHRDLKPDNILLFKREDGRDFVKVSDFGIAHLIGVPSSSPAWRPYGTSPEQLRGGYTDERSDIYSLGVITYFMLTGVYPFEGDLAKVESGHLEQTPPSLAGAASQANSLVARAMDKRPEARFATMTAFRQALRETGDPPETPGHSVALSTAQRLLFAITLVAVGAALVFAFR